MALKFIDNFIHPVQLPPGEQEVMADLPLPESDEDYYLLTLADSAINPTRYEIVEAGRDVGSPQAWIWRYNMAEDDEGFAEGSVIFCSVNSEALAALQGGFTQAEEQLLQIRLAHDIGRESWIRRSFGLQMVNAVSTVVTLLLDEDIGEHKCVRQTLIVDLGSAPFAALRISGSGRPIVSAELETVSGLTYQLDPDGEYVQITSASHRRLRIELDIWSDYHPSASGLACGLVASIQDMQADYTQLEL